ncbi:uncharacterized protein G2W53_027545 [Senna tora]|uniref:Uncharacterized protein n=1 Tax=Senna tora TaxID=362788 RepID=A0A834THW1_9FABA|nr:uncharacterized protein G2W53_027545 [Senna tora]
MMSVAAVASRVSETVRSLTEPTEGDAWEHKHCQSNGGFDNDRWRRNRTEGGDDVLDLRPRFYPLR